MVVVYSENTNAAASIINEETNNCFSISSYTFPHFSFSFPNLQPTHHFTSSTNATPAGRGLGLPMTGIFTAETSTSTTTFTFRHASFDESAIVIDQSRWRSRGGVKKRRPANSDHHSSMLLSASPNIISHANNMKDSSGKRLKMASISDGNCGSNFEAEPNSDLDNKPTSLVKDYIHVRARRGQATDSHSLAERERKDQSENEDFARFGPRM